MSLRRAKHVNEQQRYKLRTMARISNSRFWRLILVRNLLQISIFSICSTYQHMDLDLRSLEVSEYAGNYHFRFKKQRFRCAPLMNEAISTKIQHQFHWNIDEFGTDTNQKVRYRCALNVNWCHSKSTCLIPSVPFLQHHYSIFELHETRFVVSFDFSRFDMVQ